MGITRINLMRPFVILTMIMHIRPGLVPGIVQKTGQVKVYALPPFCHECEARVFRFPVETHGGL